jgi:hypothetical protein
MQQRRLFLSPEQLPTLAGSVPSLQPFDIQVAEACAGEHVVYRPLDSSGAIGKALTVAGDAKVDIGWVGQRAHDGQAIG